MVPGECDRRTRRFRSARDACQEVQPEDTVQNLTRVDTGAESSDSQGREAGSSEVEEWEAAKGKLKVEFGEELEVVQIAIVTGMLPSDLQDKVFEMVNAGDLKYHKVRNAIVGIMNNRARMVEPTPMDIGQVGGLVRESRGQLRLGWRRRTVHFRCGCSWEGHVRRLSSLRGIWPFPKRVPNTREQRQAKGGKGGVDFRFKGKGESVKGMGLVWEVWVYR